MKLERSFFLRLLRLATFALLGAVTLALLLVLLDHLAVPLLVWIAPSLETPFYDFGFFGAYRTSKYQSFDLQSPRTSIVKWEESCGNGYIFIDPNGPSVDHKGPAILDARGELVWTSDQFQTSTNLQVQRYQGQDYLTFWSGLKAKTTGTGSYFMLDSNYTIAHKVDVVGANVHGDLHEFQLTDDGTALVTIYNTTQMDLTAMGMWRTEHGWVSDSVFQEIDISTGEILFEWKASEHFFAADSYMSNPFGGYYETAPFDFFHINSVDKDAYGNYLISSRHFHAIMYIDGTSGDVLWVLGGRESDFTDLSDGSASDFSWNHHARWVSREEGLISLFDNSMAWPHINADYSRGIIVQLDTANNTVTLVHEYISLQQARSSSQGSVSIIDATTPSPADPNARREVEQRVFIGWGSSAAYSEFSLDGTLLCETHFAASWYYFWERVKSYRAFKSPEWIGVPAAWDPSARMHGGKLYVSWNGATEVAFWVLQGTRFAGEDGVEDTDYEDVDVLEKSHFEESFALPSRSEGYTHFRVAALDRERSVLRLSNVVSASGASAGGAGAWRFILGGVTAILCICAIGGLWIFVRRRGFGGVKWKASGISLMDRSKYRKL